MTNYKICQERLTAVTGKRESKKLNLKREKGEQSNP